MKRQNLRWRIWEIREKDRLKKAGGFSIEKELKIRKDWKETHFRKLAGRAHDPLVSDPFEELFARPPLFPFSLAAFSSPLYFPVLYSTFPLVFFVFKQKHSLQETHTPTQAHTHTYMHPRRIMDPATFYTWKILESRTKTHAHSRSLARKTGSRSGALASRYWRIARSLPCGAFSH